MTQLRRVVPTPNESYGDVVQRLRAAQKSAAGAPAYSRWVNRPLGGITAALAYRLRWTPNQVTALGCVFTFLAIVLLAVAPVGRPLAFTVGLALALGYVLDAADGQLARLRGGGSFAGEWLDHMADCAKVATLHLAVLICWYRNYDATPAALLIPISYAAVAVVLFFGMTLIDQIRRRAASANRSPAVTASPGASILRSLLVTPTDYGVLCLAFLTLAWPSIFAVIYSALFLTNLVLLLAALGKWWREVRAL